MEKRKRDEQYFDEQAELWWGRFEVVAKTFIIAGIIFLPLEAWNRTVPGMAIDWHWILLYLLVRHDVADH